MKYAPVKKLYQWKFCLMHQLIKTLNIISPLDGTHLSTVSLSSSTDLNTAVTAAKKYFQSGVKTPIKERVQVFFRYKYLLEKNTE
jgi:malonate-semialdehyde dehydrogenase (acetylating)/methylmalonate-semialdehyde dehydrogenase